MDAMEQGLPHSMTFKEREELKAFARKGLNISETLIMISHWMSCAIDVTFTGYASNWAAANLTDDVSAMRLQWPLEKQGQTTFNIAD